MGLVSSRPEEGAALFLRDQQRLSISSLVISSARKRTSINIVPNAFPASRLSATRPLPDPSPIEYIQDSDSASGPSFLLKLSNDDELVFNFTFVIRQSAPTAPAPPQPGSQAPAEDTVINGLTFVYASTARDVENLVTREFHADPNLHKNSNVGLVGDFSTGGSASVTFEWSWKWKPPRLTEDRGGGWRNCCSFVEYDQRAHRLLTLASFSFWVANAAPLPSQPSSPSAPFLLHPPPKDRAVSSQSVDSRLSAVDPDEPPSPVILVPTDAGSVSAPTAAAQLFQDQVKVDVSCARPGEDMAVSDDGPVFRATIKALEQKTGTMRMQMKKVIKKAEQAQTTQAEANEALAGFIEALKEVSSTNSNAVQPAIDHYFDKIAREILYYQRQNARDLQKIVIDPMHRLYTMDIKQAESKKRDFEDESKDYYAYVARYLGQRTDSVRTKKLADSDTKYQTKRRNFELKRFDYSSFMQDLSGGRKEQEVLSHLTKYADAQAKAFLGTAKKVENQLPQLEALSNEVQDADKDFQYQRREREEKRRVLEKSNAYVEPDPTPPPPPLNAAPVHASNGNQSSSDTELGRADSTGSTLRPTGTGTSNGASSSIASDLARSPGSLSHHVSVGSPSQPSKFKGIRDLEEKDPIQAAAQEKSATQRKEGLLWALNRPGGHVDPRALNKPGWHKFWIVLDQGKLSEYSNWKQKLDLHMDPIDLRLASVREARNADRRFCFEVITPQFKRVYQATSEEDMNSWINSINNALQSAVEGRPFKDKPLTMSNADSNFKRDIGSVLTGKSPSLSHGSGTSGAIPLRRTTVAGRPTAQRSTSSTFEDSPDKLLQRLRDHDQGNNWCADCGAGSKVEWVSINLAIILCIECSGIHRSLGTHISKVRSLTLDIKSFTPDIVELLLLVGNRVANMVWEAKLDPANKLPPQSTREQRLKFIKAKYEERAYVEPISATLSRYATAEETLLAGIKRNEIQQVLYALALKANPNVTDKSRGTHSVFLALAAADPAAPGATAPASTPTADKRTPFPVAELLLQNGAEIPSTMPAFPLSRSAQLYLETKRSRQIPTSSYGNGTTGSSSSQDAVGSLPTGSSGGLMSSSGSEKVVNRDREAWLAKRVSAGGRLAKSPIPER